MRDPSNLLPATLVSIRPTYKSTEWIPRSWQRRMAVRSTKPDEGIVEDAWRAGTGREAAG